MVKCCVLFEVRTECLNTVRRTSEGTGYRHFMQHAYSFHDPQKRFVCNPALQSSVYRIYQRFIQIPEVKCSRILNMIDDRVIDNLLISFCLLQRLV